MWKTRITAVLILLLGVGVGFFVFKSEVAHRKAASTNGALTGIAKYPFKLGLDLSGGTHLVYDADVSKVEKAQLKDSMDALRDVIERRVNAFGVGEPIVQVENGNFTNGGAQKLIVDLPGVTDVAKAKEMIGQTPVLEFRTQNTDKSKPQQVSVGKDGTVNLDFNSLYTPTDLTGRYLDHASLEFNQTTGEPVVSLQFNAEGSALFEKITRENIGKTVAIFLDGAPISTPTVNEAITGGKAQISGNFKPAEAKLLVGRLNSGALPVPISLVSTQTIGPSLGAQATHAGVKAALIGFLAIALFLVFWYRLPGILGVVALSMYVALVLAVFKIGVSPGFMIIAFCLFLLGTWKKGFFYFIPLVYGVFALIPGALSPVTLTAAGIAGFIISIGIAVDANVLIFERIKEEMRLGHGASESMKNGFSRAWFSIRDSNISSMITAMILWWIGTALIAGFALTFMLGVIISMICAVIITRIFFAALNLTKTNAFTNFLFGSGLSSAKAQK